MTDNKLKSSKSKCFAIAIALLLLLCVTAGRGRWVLFYAMPIAGSVVDAKTGVPLEQAIVIGMWPLSQVLSQGSGGYAKVMVVETDKDGKFKLPFWITFKPWTFISSTHDLAPMITIYKPGYKVHWSHTLMRSGFPGDISMTSEEKEIARERHGINPARLTQINTDEERLDNYDDIEMNANFPSFYYSKNERRKIAEFLKTELLQLSDKHQRKQQLLRNIDDLL